MENNIGTITWFEIAKGELPQRIDKEKYKLVLLYNDTLFEAVEGHYNFDNG